MRHESLILYIFPAFFCSFRTISSAARILIQNTGTCRLAFEKSEMPNSSQSRPKTTRTKHPAKPKGNEKNAPVTQVNKISGKWWESPANTSPTGPIGQS